MRNQNSSTWWDDEDKVDAARRWAFYSILTFLAILVAWSVVHGAQQHLQSVAAAIR